MRYLCLDLRLEIPELPGRVSREAGEGVMEVVCRFIGSGIFAVSGEYYIACEFVLWGKGWVTGWRNPNTASFIFSEDLSVSEPVMTLGHYLMSRRGLIFESQIIAISGEPSSAVYFTHLFNSLFSLPPFSFFTLSAIFATPPSIRPTAARSPWSKLTTHDR